MHWRYSQIVFQYFRLVFNFYCTLEGFTQRRTGLVKSDCCRLLLLDKCTGRVTTTLWRSKDKSLWSEASSHMTMTNTHLEFPFFFFQGFGMESIVQNFLQRHLSKNWVSRPHKFSPSPLAPLFTINVYCNV